MRPVPEFVKTMVVGGLLFLFPLVAVTAVVGKAFGLMARFVRPLAEYLAPGSAASIAVIDILAIAALLIGCFAAGLVAQSGVGRRIHDAADAGLASLVPGYAVLRARLDGVVGRQDGPATLKPVMVRFDDLSQIAFETDRLDDGRVAVFLPGAPDAWSGSAAVMDADRVTPLDVEFLQVVRVLKGLGRGTAAALGSRPAKGGAS